MSVLTSHWTPKGYAIREFPKGPLIGWVKTAAPRSLPWVATCSICGSTFQTERRVTSGKLLDAHYQTIHVRTP